MTAVTVEPSSSPAEAASATELVDRYLELLRGCLTRELFLDEEYVDVMWWPDTIPLGNPNEFWARLRGYGGWRLVKPSRNRRKRVLGRDTPPTAETMVGHARLENVERLARRALDEGIPGDFVETGVWRGGVVVLMRAVLASYAIHDRTVWGFDSFEGLPEPDLERYPLDVALKLERDTKKGLMRGMLSVTKETVESNLDRYGLLDDQVRIVQGWFHETLPDAPIEQIAVLRLDGDLYQSTLDGLTNLEPKVASNGFVIVDDYGSIEACRQAVTDYREEHGITAEIHRVDWTGVWWQKE